MALLLCIVALLSSCVTKKKFAAANAQKDQIQKALNQTTSDLAECEKNLSIKSQDFTNSQDKLAEAKKKIVALQGEIDYLKSSNNKLLDQLTNLSVISKEGAENIKKSLETLDKQSQVINELNSQIRAKDSLNLVLVLNLKRSLQDVNDQDIDIQVKKGVVLISLSDKLLYKSGSFNLNPEASTVLSKIASIINDYPTYDVLIEGNTDNVPIKNNCMTDNWDLSVKRATTIARELQERYFVAPNRIIAGGRSEYLPKVPNTSAANRAINRRTEIIIMPKIDEFFQLLETPSGDK